MSEKSSSVKVLPVLFGFFVMGFCDVVGIATSYVKQDFGLSETVAGFIPSMVFIWFLLISVPSAMWMNRVGRKAMVQLSNAVTFVGMLIPFVHYSFASCMAGFVLLGVGNTMLQVSLNPLLTNVVSGARLTSMLTAGQVIKAVSSFCGPFIAAFAVSAFGEWRYLFPIFAAVTLLSMIWLMFTDVKRETVSSGTSSSGAVFSLLKDRQCFSCSWGYSLSWVWMWGQTPSLRNFSWRGTGCQSIRQVSVPASISCAGRQVPLQVPSFWPGSEM